MPGADGRQAADDLAIESHAHDQQETAIIDAPHVAVHHLPVPDNLYDSSRVGGNPQILGQEVLRAGRAGQDRHVASGQSVCDLVNCSISAPDDRDSGAIANSHRIIGGVLGSSRGVFDKVQSRRPRGGAKIAQQQAMPAIAALRVDDQV